MSNAGNRGRFLWHELMTGDTQGAADFYARVAGWAPQPSGMPDYTLLANDGIPAAGLMSLAHVGPDSPPHWLVYIGVDDVDAAAAAAERLGGRVLKSPTDIANVGRFAVLADPQGAAFAVYTYTGTAPPPARGAVGEFSWHELATTDPESALRFYGELFGWSRGTAHDMGSMGPYQIFEHDGAQGGGMYVLQGNATPPHWLSYVRVRDVDQAVQAARNGGGRVLNGPMEVPGGSWIAVLMDPQGGSFAVHEPPQAMAAGARGTAAAAQTSAGVVDGARKPARKKTHTAPAKSRTAAARPRRPARAAGRKSAGRSAAKPGRGRSAKGGANSRGTAAARRTAGGPGTRGAVTPRQKGRAKAAGRPAAARPTARRKKVVRARRGPAAGRRRR